MEEVSESSRRRRRTREQISALLAKYRLSGLTVSDFCERHQIHKANFRKWISRYKKTNAGRIQRSAFAKVQVTSSENRLFAEVEGIRIYQVVTASYLKELKG